MSRHHARLTRLEAGHKSSLDLLHYHQGAWVLIGRRLEALERTSLNPDSMPNAWAFRLDRNIADLVGRTGIELPLMPTQPAAMFTACGAFLDRVAAALSGQAVGTVRVEANCAGADDARS